LDLDRHGDKQDGIAAAREGYGWEPERPYVETGGGGLHAYYRCPNSEGGRVKGADLGAGIQIKADGGFVVAPPSRHASGRRYTWADGPEDVPIPPCPEWVVRELRDGKADASRPTLPLDGARILREGERNNGLTRLAGKLRRQGLEQPEIEQALLAANECRCMPPLLDQEVRGIAQSVSRYPTARIPTNLDVRDFGLTDSGNAELLAARYGARLRYDHRDGQWYLWDGHYWTPDLDGSVVVLAQQAARWRGKAAFDLPAESDARTQQIKWAVKSEARNKLRDALALAQANRGLALTGMEWNADPMLLAVPNGVVDLETGKLRDGQPQDLINRCAGVPYAPDAQTFRWDTFLAEVFDGDDELVAFIQRSVGYSLTGDVREHRWFFLHGRGANGKSVLLATLQHVLGGYALSLPFACFETRRGESIPHDLAKLPGRRLAVAAESADGSTFDAAKLKNITGGDRIAARHLYRTFFDFEPTHKLWLAANRKPRVKDTSAGFWRRVLLIPFNRQFTGRDADPELTTKLRAEAEGILAWAVRGAQEWQAMGLTPPATVSAAVQEYRRENDPLAAFLDARCVILPTAHAGATELYEEYRDWAEAEGVAERYIRSQNGLGRELGERFTRHRTKHGTVYHGLGLKANGEGDVG
jgi:putative DNA primase/helicase